MQTLTLLTPNNLDTVKNIGFAFKTEIVENKDQMKTLAFRNLWKHY